MDIKTLETRNYLRLVSMFIDVGAEVIYRVFMYYVLLTGTDSEAFLYNRSALMQLEDWKRRNDLSVRQFSVDQFDISLWCNLFAEDFKPTEKCRKSKFASNDFTLGADFFRLRRYRNKLVGLMSRARLSDQMFSIYWKELETIFVKICKKVDPVNEESIQRKIQTYKSMDFDQQMEKHYRDEIQSIRENCEDIVKLQENAETLILELKELTKYFVNRPRRYSCHIRLLFEGGQVVLAAFLKKACWEQGKEIHLLVDEISKAYLEEPKERNDFRELEFKNPEEWDILYLVNAILYLCKDTIDTRQKKCLHFLLDERQNYAKLARELLDDKSFSKHQNNLVRSLIILSHGLSVEVVRKCAVSIYTCSDGVRNGGDDYDADMYLERLRLRGFKIRNLSDIYTDTFNELKEVLKKMEKEGIGFTTEQEHKCWWEDLTDSQKRKMYKRRYRKRNKKRLRLKKKAITHNSRDQVGVEQKGKSEELTDNQVKEIYNELMPMTSPAHATTLQWQNLSGEKARTPWSSDQCEVNKEWIAEQMSFFNGKMETPPEPFTRHLARLQGTFLQMQTEEISQRLKALATEICDRIKENCKNADYIWLAYKLDEEPAFDIRVFLVVEINKDCPLTEDDHIDKRFEVKYSYKKDITINEEENILYQRDTGDKQKDAGDILTHNELVSMRTVINKHADRLFANHRHLSIIEPSNMRLKDSKLIRGKCISLYVHEKGFIPFGETPFESELENYFVDIREGIAYQAMQNEGAAVLKMGCKIARVDNLQVGVTKFGTLGGFIDHPEYGICGVTSAHVLLNTMEMNELMEMGEITWLQMRPTEVYFCDENNINVKIGQFVKAVYEKGHGGNYGFEVAIFQIGRSFNTAGKFRDVAHGVDEMQQFFNIGKVLSPVSCSQGMLCLKYGATTGKTTGEYIQLIPVHTIRMVVNASKPFEDTIRLYNLMKIQNKEGRPFVLPGDSGSLVMVPGEEGESVCIGIVAGVKDDKSESYISPIGPVLEKLNVSSFKCFQQDELLSTVRALGRITERLEQSHKQTKVGLEQGLKETKEGIEQGLKETKEDLELRLEQSLKRTREGFEQGLKETKDDLVLRLDQTTHQILNVVNIQSRPQRQNCNVI